MNLRILASPLLLVSAFGFNAFGSLGDTSQPDVRSSLQTGIYQVLQNDDLQPDSWIVNGAQLANPDGLVISVGAGEALHVMELTPSELLVTLKRSEEETLNGDIPEQFIISRAEFNNSGMRFLADAPASMLAQYDNPLANQSASARGGRASGRGHRAGYAGRGSRHFAMPVGYDGRVVGVRGNCVQTVHAIIGENSVFGNGGQLAGNLLRTGRWVRTAEGTRGSVCSWNGGGPSGHVAYWDGGCYQPRYPSSKGLCGNPGSAFTAHPKLCVRKSSNIGA